MDDHESRAPRARAFLALSLTLAATVAFAGSAKSGSGASAPPSAEDPAADARAGQVLSGIPGMDFSMLPAPAQRELAQVMTDEFCHCGCPQTVAACLKSHTECKHARRMAKLAAGEAMVGTPAAEIVLELDKYYQSFHEPRAGLKIDPRLCQGSGTAKVTVVEFSDFECPYCGLARPVLEQLVKDNPGKVRLCWAPFPLQAHPNAIPAGQAALYARDQGKFWAMHDLLFENQTSLSVEAIAKLGERAGLKGAELAKVLAGKAYQEELEASKAVAKTAGVNSTPTVFVNGRKLELALHSEILAQTVDDEIEWMSHNNAWSPD